MSQSYNHIQLSGRTTAIGIISAILVLFLVSTFVFDFVKVGEREVAVITRLNQYERTVGAGWNYKTPFITAHATTYNIATQSVDIQMASTSKDQQAVQLSLNILYRIDRNKVEDIYKTIGGGGINQPSGDERIKIIIDPIIQDVAKSVSAEFQATEQLTERSTFGNKIQETLKSRLSEYNIILERVNITNIDFSEEFNKAIERKVVAQQLAEQKKFELEAEKNQLEVERVKAQTVDIQGQALRANPEVLRNKTIEKWNGVLPQVQGNNDVIIDLKN
jgi:regulator of protease activity HflC (stomatin/prohibitin superfamily)